MKVIVWNENVHEKENPEVTRLYPGGLHEYIAAFLKDDDIEIRTATLDDDECGLTEEVLADTDVLIWWGHTAHGRVPDEVAERVHRHVLAGMGFIALHSSHLAKPFTRLMGTACTLKWRDDARERLWTIKPCHPIAEGVPETFALDCEELYGETFDIPTPDEIIFLGWFDCGAVFRSGCTWVRGNGKVFYFQPGHETNASLQNKHIQRIIKNAVRWAKPVKKSSLDDCAHFEPLDINR